MDKIGKKEFPASRIRSLLPSISEKLEGDLHRIEPGFSTLGNGLQAVYADSESLTKKISESANYITDRSEEGVLGLIQKTVNESLEVLACSKDSVKNGLKTMETSSGHLSSLISICHLMKKNATFLRLVGMNISIESCRTVEAMEMFENFGNEIKALSADLERISDKIHDDSETVKDEQASVHLKIGSSMEGFSELSRSAREAVQVAMNDLDEIIKLASMTLERAGTHSSDISGIVGNIVMSIQFHDIARQQIEHIISALKDITELSADVEKTDDESEKDEKTARIYSILNLQAAQLKQVISQADEINGKIHSSFLEIGKEVEHLMKNVTASEGRNGRGVDLEGQYRSFMTTLEELGQLLARGYDLGVQMQKTMDQSSNAVSTLASHTSVVNKINIDLQYKAINAIIMTSRLGEKGATLEVLARSVRDLSEESDSRVKDVLEIIESITKLAVSSEDGGEVQGLKNGTMEPDTGLDDVMQRMSLTYENYRESSSMSVEIAKKLISSIEDVKAALDFIPEWISSTGSVLAELQDIMMDLEPWKKAAEEMDASENDLITQRYTMESERAVHASITSGSLDVISEDPDTGEDDLDDNIELF